VEEAASAMEEPKAIHGFNGATAMKPWKRDQPCFRRDPPHSLQWGHGDEAVEETEPMWLGGPATRLQWGHGDEAVEEDVKNTVRFTRNMLQWGHGDEAVEE